MGYLGPVEEDQGDLQVAEMEVLHRAVVLLQGGVLLLLLLHQHQLLLRQTGRILVEHQVLMIEPMDQGPDVTMKLAWVAPICADGNLKQ